MKEFDLERAKAGEPIEYLNANGNVWQAVEFIADWNDHDAVCRVPYLHHPVAVSKAVLRMAPKKTTWYCLIVQSRYGLPILLNHASPVEWDKTMKWIGIPFTLEVEQE